MNEWRVSTDPYQQAYLADDDGVIAKAPGFEAVFQRIANRHNAETISSVSTHRDTTSCAGSNRIAQP